MDLMVLLWKQEGTEAGSLTFLCLPFKKTVMSMCSGNLLSICIYFYNYMEISGTVGVMGEKWIAVVGTVLQTCDFGGQMSFLSNWVHLIKLVSLSLGSWVSALLLLTLTTSVCSEFLISPVFGKCCLQFVPLSYRLGTAIITIDSSAAWSLFDLERPDEVFRAAQVSWVNV